MSELDEAKLFARMQTLDRDEKLSYSERGRIAKAVRDTRIHEQRIDPETGEPCGWTRWVTLCSPWSYAVCFAAVRDIEALADISSSDLAQVPQANFPILKQLSSAVRALPSVLKAAQTQRSDQFADTIKRNFPDQHLEQRKMLRFQVDESEETIIEEVIKAMQEGNSMTKSQVLVSIFMDAWVKMNTEGLAK